MVSSGVPRGVFSPEAVYFLRRRCADITLFGGALGTVQAVSPPGFSGTSFFTVGTPFADSAAPTYNVNCIPFTITPSLASLNQYLDVTGLFSEYQIRSAQIEISLLCGESAAPGNGLPEVITYREPNGFSPPTTVGNLDAHVTNRTVLCSGRVQTYRARPVPAMELYAGVITTQYGQAPNVWINAVSAADLPHYAFSGMFRNFTVTNACGVIVRIDVILDMAFRRPH